MNKPSQSSPPQPVAYDAEGRPLYHHPPSPQNFTQAHTQTSPQAPVVAPQHVQHHDNQNYHTDTASSQSIKGDDSNKHSVSGESLEVVKKRHERSKKKYPNIALNDTEYVVRCATRHPIGIFYIWAAEVVAMVLLAGAWVALVIDPTIGSGIVGSREAQFYLAIMMIALQLFLLAIGWVGTVVYRGNRFIVTNERVIQYIQTGLFNQKRQTIDLRGVEDVSHRKEGVIQHIFNYGSIRLSTVGSETTYRFNLVENPKTQTERLNGAVHAYKVGRPISEDHIEKDILSDS